MICISDLSMRFGAKVLFKNVSLQFNAGNCYGLIGANGSGKSTLIKILMGEAISDRGTVSFLGQYKVGSLSQNHDLYREHLILDVVLQGKIELWDALNQKKHLLEKEKFNEQECQTLEKLETIIQNQGGYSAESEAAHLLEGLGIRQEWHTRPLECLSGGYKLRVLLAKVLFSQPDILLLDEPTNHLDLYSIKWLEDYLHGFPGMIIVASHDRNFLNVLCTHIADVDYGTIKIYKGNFEEFQQQKAFESEQKGHMLQKNDKRKAELQGFIDRFGAKATKARQAQTRVRMVAQLEEEIEKINLAPSSRIYPQLSFIPHRQSGITVLTVKEIGKTFGDKTVLKKVSFEVERGEKVAIIGPNGIGKSTLLEIIMQNHSSDQGTFNWGFATRLAYFPQNHAREVTGTMTLLEWLGQFDYTVSQESLRGLLGSVLFSGDLVNQSITTLSGGETARLLIAKMMLQKPNVLIFDEPTNHLDIEAIEELIKALDEFEGTVLFVSHNRYFVSRLAKRIVEISSCGVTDFKGSYAEYLEKREEDYLTSQPILSKRYASEEQSINKLNSNHNPYEIQKRLKSQRAQLRKKVIEIETLIEHFEKKLQEIDLQMASESFYLKTSREDQALLLNQKRQVEKQLSDTMIQWEKAGSDLQNCEKTLP